MKSSRFALCAVGLSMAAPFACAETPALPPDSPENPASTAAPAAMLPAPTVLTQALAPYGGSSPGKPGSAPAPRVAPVDHSHHHHTTDAPDAGQVPAKGHEHP